MLSVRKKSDDDDEPPWNVGKEESEFVCVCDCDDVELVEVLIFDIRNELEVKLRILDEEACDRDERELAEDLFCNMRNEFETELRLLGLLALTPPISLVESSEMDAILINSGYLFLCLLMPN